MQVHPGAVGTRHVLVVDDDPIIRDYVVETLRDEGYVCAQAANGRLALDRLQRERETGLPPPDVILLDMRMPVMDGWTFARVYQEQFEPRAPIVVITAAHDSHERAREVSAEGVLPKPFDIEQLLAEVDRVSARAR